MRRRYHLMTPEKAWQRYGYGVSVEFFITDYFYAGHKDIWEMCRQHISDGICQVDGLVTVEERAHVTKLFYQYVRNYIDSQGGIDKLQLLNHPDHDFAWHEDLDKLISDLKELETSYK